MSSTAAQPKITLYWLNESRAQRIVWLLEELHVDYNVEIFHRKDMLAPPELERIHPLGKAPVVTIDAPTGKVVLAETGFISQYLCDHFGQATTLVPSRYPTGGQEGVVGGETDEWMRLQYFMHYAEGSLMPPLLVAVILSVLKGPKMPFFIRPITGAVANKIFSSFVFPNIAKHLQFLESQLATSPNGGQYLCGAHLTAADIILSFPLLAVRDRFGGMDISVEQQGVKLLDQYPKLWAYVARLEQEDGFKRAEAKIAKLGAENVQTS
ncbi:glutathione S-transferase [Podospora appendiculata]|uniref:Glutathione S-transferase n=1 Tax=Podospora appendiculata TaxID=314037 RepID=A0AAE0WZL8_9PEZI|nr:glutathione S-transferase [Podospora appendiculata]